MQPSNSLPNARVAAFLFRWRWPLSLIVLLLVFAAVFQGAQRVIDRTSSLGSLGDTSNGSGEVPPLVFDPTMDVWFGEKDTAVTTFYEIEDRFVAEDFVMVTFEVPERELGVFDPEALATIARLTERFLTVPGVRHVRSLTYNPWIRWGTISDQAGEEPGLIISDLVESDPFELSEAEIAERMVAILGAHRASERLGDERVRAVLGAEAAFDDAIGEPRLLGTILDETATTTTIQVQVLRPRVDETALAEAFAGDEAAQGTAAALYSIQVQRSAVRGIEHHLRAELGLALPTPEFDQLLAQANELPEGEEKTAALLHLHDPTRNFIQGEDGALVRKYFEYEPDGAGGYVDRSGPEPVAAPEGFRPEPRSNYEFHLGGVPFFERNFEEVGMADSRFVPLMFLIIAVALFWVFRGPTGVLVPLAVVFFSIAGMLGLGFIKGDLLNNLTMMSPNMLTAVAIADAIHLLASWTVLRSRYADKRELITEVVRRNALPVLLTSLTTAVGFYSLTVSKLAPVTMLGYTAGTGALIAFLLSMTLIPAALWLVPHRGAAAPPSRLAGFFTPKRSDRLIATLLRRRFPILLGAGALAVISVFGLTRVEIDTDFRGMFPDDNPTMSDFHWIESRLGGVGDLEIVFSGLGNPDAPAPEKLTTEEEARLEALRLRDLGTSEHPDEFLALTDGEQTELARLSEREAQQARRRIGVSTEFLGALDAFENRLRSEMADPNSDLAVITDLISPLDILRKMHQVQNENRASHYRVPNEDDVPAEAREPQLVFDDWLEEWSRTPGQNGATLAAQYYLQYENGARPGENLATQLSADRAHFRMQGRVVQAPSSAHRAAFARIEEIARDEFPELGANLLVEESEDSLSSLTLSGKTLLFARTTHLFTVGFMQSMTIALIAITLLIGLIFRSPLLALVSLVPNVLPIVVPLAAFGLLGLPIHGPAILVSSVALGVCVDDTIHFLTKFSRARQAGKPTEEALSYVLQESGAAITITTVILMVGFGTLLLSDFTPNFMMGTLATLMIGLAWVADLIVLPAVLGLFARDQISVASEETASQPALAS